MKVIARLHGPLITLKCSHTLCSPILRPHAQLNCRKLSRRQWSSYPRLAPHGALSRPQWAESRHFSSLHSENDTIYALSTPSGTSAIAVVRISGPSCVEIYHALCPDRPLPKPRYASLRVLYTPQQVPSVDTVLDPGSLILYFPAPNTVTGEDVLELHIHGGAATIKAVLAAIPRSIDPGTLDDNRASAARARVRYAQAGEFTRRAFQNARLSLPQIEALAATLAAQTEQQRRLAARGSRSGLGGVYEAWRTRLLHARAELEALIDFSEDQHFDESPRELASNVARMVEELVEQMRVHRENAVRGEMMRCGIRVALLGAPNSGKSSLLNEIVGREAAIVSREAGTTRDVVEVGVDLGGWLVKFGDLAGLRGGGASDSNSDAAVGEVEREGIRRAKERALQSDVVIVVLPVEAGGEGTDPALMIDSEVIQTALRCIEKGRSIVVAINKIDRLASDESREALLSVWQKTIQELLFVDKSSIFCISCKSDPSALRPLHGPANIQSLLHGLTDTFNTLTRPLLPSTNRDSVSDALSPGPPDMTIWQDSLGASERQRLLLEDCTGHLATFLALAAHDTGAGYRPGAHAVHGGDAMEEEVDIVVAAESLRAAAECLARITGCEEAGDVEEVLGVVFEK